MKKQLIGILVVLVVAIMSVSTAFAHGHTVDQLENAGWFCMEEEEAPYWFHCVKSAEKLFSGTAASIPVKVFGPGGAEFLGTEILIHEDVYNTLNSPPCMTDGGGAYDYLGFVPYYACHHFETGH